jgi:hypothetical protein
MSTTMDWLESHIGSLDAGVELARKMYWPLHIEREDDTWYVMSAEQIILSSNSRVVVDAFIYGMGLAYAGIPKDLLDKLSWELKNRGFAG